MSVVCVVQARMGSSRFPGKIAQEIGDKPALAHVLSRCKKIEGVNRVVCAVADTPGNEILLDIIAQEGVIPCPGAEFDPLSRTLSAARFAGALSTDDIVMRVTSDCPMIDPVVCSEVLYAGEFARGLRGSFYVSNVHPRSFPQGLDCEVFNLGILADANDQACSSYDREHVTPWIRRTADRTGNVPTTHRNLSHMRWTLDYPRDLMFMREVWFAAGQELPLSYKDTVKLIEANPKLGRVDGEE